MLKRMDCKGVGDNDGFFEIETLQRQLIQQVALPKHLLEGKEPSTASAIRKALWDVHKRKILMISEHDT